MTKRAIISATATYGSIFFHTALAPHKHAEGHTQPHKSGKEENWLEIMPKMVPSAPHPTIAQIVKTKNMRIQKAISSLCFGFIPSLPILPASELTV